MDERKRQKRRERKHRKREVKRTAAAGLRSLLHGLRQPPLWIGPTLAPTPKMSDTLVALAQEELDCMPDDATADQLEGLLLIAMSVWNAVVIGSESTLDARLWELSRTLQPPAGIPQRHVFASLRAMAERKQRLFAQDHRLVVSVTVVNEDGHLRILAMSAPGPSPR